MVKRRANTGPIVDATGLIRMETILHSARQRKREHFRLGFGRKGAILPPEALGAACMLCTGAGFGVKADISFAYGVPAGCAVGS